MNQILFLTLKLNLAVRTSAVVPNRNIIKHTVFSHLVFVEFQYTTCLLATAAEIMFKRKIVAFQAGTAPGVHIREPILSAARAAVRLGTSWEWGANQVRRPDRGDR